MELAAEGGSTPGSPVACVVATLERSIKPKLKSAGRVHLQGRVSVIARRLCLAAEGFQCRREALVWVLAESCLK